MVLESLLAVENARQNPLKIIALSAVFASIAILLTTYLKLTPPGFMLIILVITPSIPFVLNAINKSEEEDEKDSHFLGSRTLSRHLPTIAVLFAFFIGLTAAFTFWYTTLPADESNALFASQVTELKNVQNAFSGKATQYALLPTFELIFLHNLTVLGLIIGFSLLYGAGAVYVLAWNASVIAVFLGNFAKNLAGFWSGLGIGVLGILPHGSFELLAYSTGTLAGGILSKAAVNEIRNSNTPIFHIAYDAVKLVGWSILFLALGALIETTGAMG